jgi:GNAT superfamily N-acetyltransferase
MSHPSVTVRPATEADLPALLSLWSSLRAVRRDGVASRGGKEPSRAVVVGAEERLLEVLRSPKCRVVVADVEGAVAGMAILSDTFIGQLLEMPAVQLTHLVVAEGQRRRGVGRALLAGAVTWAEEVGADEIVASVLPSLREANRFYARLGFAPLVMRRVVPVTTLRRNLAMTDPRGARPRRRRSPLTVSGVGLGLRSRLAYAEPESVGQVIVLPD